MISWKRWLTAAIAVVLLAACVAGISTLRPEEKEEYIAVTLEGERQQTLAVGESFEDAGYSAAYYMEGQKEVPVEVTVTGSVDTQRVGIYLLTYTARYGGCTGTAYRRICVTDDTPPVITLVENPEGYTLPGHAYEEEGFTATDNYDGDLTGKVVRKDLGKKIIYTVKDSSGNKTTVTRTVKIDDPVPPELKLKGNSYMIVNLGSAYQEPGWEAADNCDGDLSDKVEVSGSVNTQVAGTYVLTYKVKDAFGNLARQERKVKVEERSWQSGTVVPLPEIVPPEGERIIYLTFDDGPSQYTPALLDVLAKYGVKATFFVVNNRYAGTMQRILAEGHTLAIHTASHRYEQIYAGDDAYFADLYKMQDIIKSNTGYTSTILRFPGGSSNSTSKKYNAGIMTRLTKRVKELGFRYFDWNVDSKDAGGAKTAEAVFYNVVTGVQKHNYSVVLQHDIKSYSVDAVESIIQWGLTNGYTFLPLTMESPVCEHTPRN